MNLSQNQKVEFINWVCANKSSIRDGLKYSFVHNKVMFSTPVGTDYYTIEDFITAFPEKCSQWLSEYAKIKGIDLTDRPVVEAQNNSISINTKEGVATVEPHIFFDWICAYENEVQSSSSYWSNDKDSQLIIKSFTETKWDHQRGEAYEVPYQASTESYSSFINSEPGRSYVELYMKCEELEFVKQKNKEYYREDFTVAA